MQELENQQAYRDFTVRVNKTMQKIDLMAEKCLLGEAVQIGGLDFEVDTLCEQAKHLVDSQNKKDIERRLQDLVAALDSLVVTLKTNIKS